MEKDDTISHTAIRCAKAAMLLHSVRIHRQQQEKEMKNETIDDLKMELVNERFKRRHLTTCNLLEFFVLIVLLFLPFTFALLVFFELI